MRPTTLRSIAVSTLLPTLFACGSTRDVRGSADSLPPDDTLAILAAELVDAAEQRGDARAMRLCVVPLETRQGQEWAAPRDGEVAALGAALERELVFALSQRLHVLDREVAAGVGADDGSVDEIVERTGATHAALGQFVRTGDELTVWVRLVEAQRGVIVAAAKRSLPGPGVRRGPVAHVGRAGARPGAAPARRPRSRRRRRAPRRRPRSSRPRSASRARAGSSARGPSRRDSPAAPPAVEPEGEVPAQEVAETTEDPPPVLEEVADLDDEDLPPVDGPASLRFQRLRESRVGGKDEER